MEDANIIKNVINAHIFIKDIKIEKIKRFCHEIKSYNYRRMLELLNLI